MTTRLLGVLRSLAIYYGQPVKTWRARRFYGAFVGPGDLAFDIGAHVGNRVGHWLSLGARVVAVEPQPDFVQLLHWFYGHREDVVIEALGVAAVPGRGRMLISRATPTVSTFSAEFTDRVAPSARWAGVRWDDHYDVALTTLDALIERHGVPKFVKVDVEGLEAEVLAGLSTPVPGVSFEAMAETRDGAMACVDRLQALGDYEFRASRAETMRWHHERWLDAAQMQRELANLTPTDGSGDVYARLRDGTPPARLK